MPSQSDSAPALSLRPETLRRTRVDVPVRYEIAADGLIGFAVGTYNQYVFLTIDPTLVFSTFVGGNSNGSDQGFSIAIDSAGKSYGSSVLPQHTRAATTGMTLLQTDTRQQY